jgi:hypothetical protein
MADAEFEDEASHHARALLMGRYFIHLFTSVREASQLLLSAIFAPILLTVQAV